jgi:hypothetical protein
MMAMSCDLDFRALNQNFAVGAHCARSRQAAEQLHSADKYVIDWETGRTRKASEEEWNHADTLLTSRAVPRDTKFEKWGHRFTYEEKQFHIAGGLEYLNDTNTLRLSPDGSLLAVNSWDGEIACPEDAWIWNCHINGHYYVEFYGVASAQRALLITGEFHGVEPFGMFDQGGWLSRRYYVVPQDVGGGLRHFLLCAVPHPFTARPKFAEQANRNLSRVRTK